MFELQLCFELLYCIDFKVRFMILSNLEIGNR